jgi:hypothetical protein
MSKWKLGKIVKRYGGGGGGGGSKTVVTENIPDWAKPAIQDVQAEAKSKYISGQLDNVAGVSGLQGKAFGMGDTIQQTGAAGLSTLQDQSSRLTNMAKTGGAEELQDALALDIGMGEAKIGQDYGASGTLGSYRQNLASATAKDATKAKFAQQVIQNKAAAEAALGTNVGAQGSVTSGTASKLADLGGQQRSIEQQIQDKDWQSLQRYASTVYGNPARQSAQTTQTGGGGK